MCESPRDFTYKSYAVLLSYDRDYGEYLIQVSESGRERLLYYATLDEYESYGEESILDKAISLYNLRIEIMEQIG